MSGSPLLFVERGQRLEIMVGPRRERQCHAWVVGHEDDLLWVGWRPARPDDELEPPGTGEPVTVFTARHNDARYLLHGEIAAVEAGGVGCLGLRLYDARRVQDREFVRVPVALDPEPGVVVGPDGSRRTLTLHVHDLSGGGIGATSSMHLAPGDELRSQLRLPPRAEPVVFGGRVIRVLGENGSTRFSCVIGSAFIDLTPRDREQIVHFVMQVQRELRRRGLV